MPTNADRCNKGKNMKKRGSSYWGAPRGSPERDAACYFSNFVNIKTASSKGVEGVCHLNICLIKC